MSSRFFCITALGLMISTSAFAQESVTLRAGQHDKYARIVFDWPAASPYKTERLSSGALKLSFDRAAQFSSGGFSPDQTGGLVSGVKLLSAAGQKLQVQLDIPAQATVRHFTIGNRVIIDITGPMQKQAAKAESKPEEKKDPLKKSEPKAAAPAAAPQITPAPAIEAVEQTPQKINIAEHKITLRSTEAAGMAVFRRGDALWIVLDRNDIKSPPELTGPTPDVFGKFKPVQLANGMAYTMTMPENADLNVYGDGGGLVWNVILTPQVRNVTPAVLQRNFAGTAGGVALLALRNVGKIVDVPDPDNGDAVRVVTVNNAADFAGPFQGFVDFSILQSPIGVALVSKVDNLNVRILPTGVEIGKPGLGLSISRMKDIARHAIGKEVSVISQMPTPEPESAPGAVEAVPDKHVIPGEFRRIYDFDRWRMGGDAGLEDNQRAILAGAAGKDKNGLVQNLLTLAKLNIANDHGQEAIGYIDYASDLMPEISEGPEFRSLRGAAYALAGKHELALQDFGDAALKDYAELNYWRAYALANLEDWQQAIAVMPRELQVLTAYPQPLLERVGLKLAEVSLRNGNADAAKTILSAVGRDRKLMRPWTKAALDYLDGEAERQKKDTKKASSIWGRLAAGDDQLHRAKAGLALTMMELQSGDADLEKAVHRLEGLRYTWRGDEIEARINFVLGKLYLERNEYIKAFSIMREAASLSPNSEIGREIDAFMRDGFRNLLMSDKDLKPTEAATVYEEFPDLVPPGDEGDKLLQKLSDRLLEADLLNRSSALLQKQVDTRLQGADKARIATQLAAIYLLDDAPENAIKALDAAQEIYAAQKDEFAAQQLHKIMLMRAKALAMSKRVPEALALLNKAAPAPDVSRLRADIAWQSGSWEEAAESLQNLIIDENIDPQRQLTDDQAGLILNRAVALNLSGNRVALTNMRQRYEAAMARTSRSRLFDVVTRPRQGAFLSDRETLQSIVGEVNIFKEFLENYRAGNEKPPEPAEVPPASDPPAAQTPPAAAQ